MTTIDLIKRHEGVRLKPYHDTSGTLTIGYGRNLSIKGISLPEADFLLTNDIAFVASRLERLSWYICLDSVRQSVMVDIAFNVGFNGLLEFTDMVQALMDRDWSGAATALLASKWATQVGTRAADDANILRTGVYE